MFTNNDGKTRYYKTDFIDELRKDHDFTVDGAKFCYEAFVSTFKRIILSNFSGGEYNNVVDIPDIGAFRINYWKERTVRNPKINEVLRMAPHFRPGFKPSKKFKEECNKVEE